MLGWEIKDCVRRHWGVWFTLILNWLFVGLFWTVFRKSNWLLSLSVWGTGALHQRHVHNGCNPLSPRKTQPHFAVRKLTQFYTAPTFGQYWRLKWHLQRWNCQYSLDDLVWNGAAVVQVDVFKSRSFKWIICLEFCIFSSGISSYSFDSAPCQLIAGSQKLHVSCNLHRQTFELASRGDTRVQRSVVGYFLFNSLLIWLSSITVNIHSAQFDLIRLDFFYICRLLFWLFRLFFLPFVLFLVLKNWFEPQGCFPLEAAMC